MSYVKPTRRPPDNITEQAVTFLDFFQQNFELRTICRRCALAMNVGKPAILAMDAMHLSPWDRHPKCQKVGCDGRADYFGKRFDDERWHKLTRRVPKDGLQ